METQTTMATSERKPFVLERIIEASARNAFLVIVLVLFGIAGGIWALMRTPLDAIPDLSDVQVIISTKFIAAPKVKFVRGESMFGKSFVYVIFEDGTELRYSMTRERAQ